MTIFFKLQREVQATLWPYFVIFAVIRPNTTQTCILTNQLGFHIDELFRVSILYTSMNGDRATAVKE